MKDKAIFDGKEVEKDIEKAKNEYKKLIEKLKKEEKEKRTD